MKSLFFSIAVLLAFVNLGLGLKCYSGGEKDTDDDDLKEEVGNQPMQTCTTITTIYKDKTSIIRGGDPKKTETSCTEAAKLKICYCNTDACNTATPTSTTYLLSLLILPVIITYFV